jgi:hypothetical protein
MQPSQGIKEHVSLVAALAVGNETQRTLNISVNTDICDKA